MGKTNSSNFKEKQSLAIQSYKTRHGHDEELFRAYLVKNTLKTNHLDTRQHPDRVRNVPDRFGDSQLTIRNILCQNNNSSIMSVITIDEALSTQLGAKSKEVNSLKTRFTKVHVKPKKRKRNFLTNCSKKKSKVASSIPAIINNVVTKEVTVCSHKNCLVKQSMLVVYGINNCLKYVHHIYQNNIDQSVYGVGFESNFGLVYRCLECVSLEMKTLDRKMICNKNISKTSNKFIEENDIGKINDTLEHISSEVEVSSEK